MGARGPAPRPKLQILKEGNPTRMTRDHIDRQVELPPSAPDEPDWADWFPPVPDEAERSADAEAARARAAREWAAIVPLLAGRGYLAEVDGLVLSELCITAARILLLERDITRNGASVDGERGKQKNPAVTAVNQYRTHLRHLMTQLYLTPVARARALAGVPTGNDVDDPFDV